MAVDKRSAYTEFAVDGIGGSPSNGSFSMAITNFARNDIGETRPISKACQRVMRVIDSQISARSSEREHRILAASRSAKRALLHREREGGLNVDSQYILTRSFCDLHGHSVTYTYVCFQKLRDYFNM